MNERVIMWTFMKYVSLMYKVKCMCCVLVNVMCLSLGWLGSLGVSSIKGCYLYIALVWLGVVLGDGYYV